MPLDWKCGSSGRALLSKFKPQSHQKIKKVDNVCTYAGKEEKSHSLKTVKI
jgi:hypothetical protein